MNYQHKEAYCLMWYACPCGHRERVWNSRDGVTPFGGLLCISCGGKGLSDRGMAHAQFYLDECVVDHKLNDGQLFFRDGTPEEAVAILERRFVHFEKNGDKVPDHIRNSLLDHARNQREEWQKGWPMAERYRAS